MIFNEAHVKQYVENSAIIDESISMQTDTGKFYYLFDGLGSVTGLTNTGGSLVATYSYDAFGNILSETGDATLNAINPYRFTSRVYDKESGLYYYRARYYDSKTGRFTQKDPLRSELTEGNNLYVYVGNNPVNWKDPLGLATTAAIQYKVCVWGWCYRVTYGYQIRLERSETTQFCTSGVAAGLVVTTSGAGLGSYIASALGALGVASALSVAAAIVGLIAAYRVAICYVHDAGYRVALNWYPATGAILWVMSW